VRESNLFALSLLFMVELGCTGLGVGDELAMATPTLRPIPASSIMS
jgi:hypothetical protein